MMAAFDTLSRPVRPGILSIPKHAGDRPALLASRCGSCGAVTFPPEDVCPGCYRSDTIREVRLSSEGTLYSYTVIRSAPPGFTAPYAVGYVDLPEGIRLFSQILTDRFEDLRIGMPLALVVGPLRRTNDVDIIGYKFRPAGTGRS
jgi:uncharacterized OB-fold protein